MNTLDDAVAALSRLGCNPVKSGDGYAARCPLHEAKGSHSPSLTLALNALRSEKSSLLKFAEPDPALNGRSLNRRQQKTRFAKRVIAP